MSHCLCMEGILTSFEEGTGTIYQMMYVYMYVYVLFKLAKGDQIREICQGQIENGEREGIGSYHVGL